MEALLDALNIKQQEAVTAPLVNTLVLAGAGSGKTRVLVSRIAWLIEYYHFPAPSILAVTFTNKAALEMKNRLTHLLKTPLLGMWVGTFHGLCHKFLRLHHLEAKLPEHFHILDSEDQARIIKRVIADLNLSEDNWPVKQAQIFINSKKDEGLRPQHIHAQDYGPTNTLLKIYKNYEQVCTSSGVIDFAELLLRTFELLRDNPPILAHYRARFKAVLVDEFQDTNTIQYAWIRILAGDSAVVMAVGDDDQSIYGWRGAKVGNIQQFPEDFKKAEIIRLEQNYRSTSTILKAANALITHNQNRLGKNLWTEGEMGEKIVVYSAINEIDEARFTAERIKLALENTKHTLNDIAILYRSNAQSRVLEEALLRAGIAYRIYGGVSFYARAEVKDALAYFRLLVNQDDDSAFERIINLPTRGLGEKTLESLRTLAKQDNISLWQSANQHLEAKLLPARASTSLSHFITLISNLKAITPSLALDEQIMEVINTSGLYAHFAGAKDKAESRLENLQELVNAARQFRYEEMEEETYPLLTAFLAQASLEAKEMQAQEYEHHVHLMTLHAAKGLEFPLVFLVGMEEGLFPSKMSIGSPEQLEEERRLCYVGMTRAMQKLFLSYAQIRRQYGREEIHRPSRFFRELPEELLEETRVHTQFKMPPSYPKMAERESSGFRLGQAVKHAKFGEGTVLAVEGAGAHTRIQVNFAYEGSKWLVLAYANLMPV